MPGDSLATSQRPDSHYRIIALSEERLTGLSLKGHGEGGEERCEEDGRRKSLTSSVVKSLGRHQVKGAAYLPLSTLAPGLSLTGRPSVAPWAVASHCSFT